MIKPTLVVLAAGMGSRYGSLKQMDGVGPANEAIMDYSVYDAIRAGFGKVVFVIRHSFEREFREVFDARRFGGRIEVEYVFQELEYLPEGFTVPEGRVKPWGTNHAAMMAAQVVHEPFGVINADDFYGADAFRKLGGFLSDAAGRENEYCMVGYRLENTLSDFGTVSRGVCEVGAEGDLRSVTERFSIERKNGAITYMEDGAAHALAADTLVSMNFFGFTPDYFRHSEEYFKTFLAGNAGSLTAEFYLPAMVNKLINDGTARMKVLSTDSQWFGVTYKEDRPAVERKIRSLIGEGVYPERLWG